MRNKIYTSLFLGMGLVLGATAGHAKTSSNSKKHATPVKHVKEAGNHSKSVANKARPGLASKQKPDSHKAHSSLSASHNKSSHTEASAKHSGSHEQLSSRHTKSHELAKAHGKNSHKLANGHHNKSSSLASRKHKPLHERLASKRRRGSHHDGSDAVYAKRREEELVVEEAAVSEDENQPEAQNLVENTQEMTDQWGSQLTSIIKKTSRPDEISAIEAKSQAKELTAPALKDVNERGELSENPHDNHWNTQLSRAVINNPRIHSVIENGHKPEFIRTATTSNQENQPVTNVHAVITTSLADAGEQAGLSEDLIKQLTDIFAWDIDFATNLQPGDSFTVMYEQNNPNNPIIAAQFINDGRVVTAFRYKDSEGMVNYYAPDGKSMRKAFLSSPLEFLHVSSHFNLHRRHPILNRIRAHKGVDYAARTGTPVKAAGNGEIAFIGRKGGYGQTLIIKHGDHYETVYAHLSDFKKGLSAGDTVKQGEVVAYVGQTGLATGPHLHYEFRIDGVHQNPETLNTGHTLAENNDIWNDFHTKTLPLLVQINKIKSGTLFAENQASSSNN